MVRKSMEKIRMEIKNFPVLCGGTFFTLLLAAAKQGLNERKKWGESAAFTESDVFEALIQVAIPTYKPPTDDENFKSVVSAYKSCSKSKSGRLPIHEQANITTFNNLIMNDYQTPLSTMVTLITKYIDFDGKGYWLIKALLELISMDNRIKDTDQFFISEDGRPITKYEINNLTDIWFSAFLLGVWHFIIINKIENILGKDTYDGWCKPGASKNTTMRINYEYYNLFVVGDEMFNENFFLIDKKRALTISGGIEPHISKQFASLTDEIITMIKTFPSLFTSENHQYGRTDDNHFALFGLVTDIKIQENGIKIYFHKFCSIPQQRLNEIALNLAIKGSSSYNELNRTHWTIKQINLIEELRAAGISVLIPT
jgi:hypothetical protein